MKVLGKIGESFDILVKWTIVALMLTISFVMLAQVIIRYVFNYPLIWAEEAVRFAFVWLVFMSAFAALKRGEVIAMDFVVKRMPRIMATIMTLIARLAMIFFLSIALYSGYDMTLFVFQRGTPSPAIGLHVWVVYLSLPVGCLLMLLHVIGRMIKELREAFSPLATNS